MIKGFQIQGKIFMLELTDFMQFEMEQKTDNLTHAYDGKM